MESTIYCHDNSHLNAVYLMPYPRAGAQALMARLESILETEKIDFIIPCLDSEIMNYITLQEALAHRGVKMMLPSKAAFLRRNKDSLSLLCNQIDIATPKTKMAHDAVEAARLVEQIGYPVYVKGIYYEAHLATTEAELYAAFKDIAEMWGLPVMVQEMVVGEEYDVVGLGDGRGSITGSCSIRKMLRTSAGKGFAGVVVADTRIDDLARRFIRALRWAGPFELEFIKAPGQQHMIFEMNPRFPAWVDFPSQLGCNLPACLLEQLMETEQTPLAACEPGKMFIRHSIDVLGDIAELAALASTGERTGSPLFNFSRRP
jgi:carbamoyl-phosphate synthase large subunit